jgi:hypothetical protein
MVMAAPMFPTITAGVTTTAMIMAVMITVGAMTTVAMITAGVIQDLVELVLRGLGQSGDHRIMLNG